MPFPRLILADDHTILLEAFGKLLEPFCDVVATVADGHALLEAVARLRPDVVVLDINMPLLNGLDAARQIKGMVPSAKLIFLTVSEDPDFAAEAIRMGASAYLLKKSAASELFQSIRLALKNKTYVTPQVAQRLEDAFVNDPQGRKFDRTLTPRQREVAQLLAEGKSMKQAADVLSVTARTIAFHKYRIMGNLGLKTNAELIQFAFKKHILM